MCSRTDSAENDASLVRRLQDGESAAFDILFDRYRGPVFGYLTAFLHDRGLAEDIVQECFIELVRRVKRIDPDRGVAPWLYRVARNRAIDVLRRRKHEVMPDDQYFVDRAQSRVDDAVGNPAAKMIENERMAHIRAAIDQLNPKERDLVLLRFYGDLTFKEIARVLRRPLGTVLWQTRRCVQKLGRVLDGG